MYPEILLIESRIVLWLNVSRLHTQFAIFRNNKASIGNFKSFWERFDYRRIFPFMPRYCHSCLYLEMNFVLAYED